MVKDIMIEQKFLQGVHCEVGAGPRLAVQL